MNYSQNKHDVRVDFFKESGKWYATESISWEGWYSEPDIFKAFAQVLGSALIQEDGTFRYGSLKAVCLEPYHFSDIPLMTGTSVQYFIRDHAGLAEDKNV